jgi:ribosomal protein L3
VHSVDAEQNLLLVRGAVPGPKNGIVEVREEVRRGGS